MYSELCFVCWYGLESMNCIEIGENIENKTIYLALLMKTVYLYGEQYPFLCVVIEL